MTGCLKCGQCGCELEETEERFGYVATVQEYFWIQE